MAVYDPPQPIWKRIFAGIFDFTLAATVFAVVLYQFFGEFQSSNQTGDRYELSVWGMLALVVLIAAYFIVLGRTGGTVFQRLFSMKRADDDDPGRRFGQAVRLGWENYFVFKGRASRSEYWYFVLFL